MSLFSKYKNQLDFDGNWFRALALDDAIVDDIEKLGGVKRPTKAEPCWKIPATPFHTAEIGCINRLKWTEQAAAHARYLTSEASNRLALSRGTESDLDFAGFGLNLHGYQKAGVEYMLKANRVLLGDEMGLGKSAQALAFLFKRECYPVLIICPVSLKGWWKQEGERCLPGKRFAILDSKFKPLELQMADVAITNYEQLAAGWETPEKKTIKLTALGEALKAHPFQAIIFDEMHKAKSHAAQQTKACRMLAEGKPVRIGITGTPVTNGPKELAPLAQILGRLNDLGGWYHFMQRFCAQKSKYNQFGGSQNEKELNTLLRSSFYVRRTKDDVKLALPPLTRSIVPVDIDNRAEYEFAEAEFIRWVKEKALEDEKYKESIKHLPEATQRAMLAEYASAKAARAKRAEAMIKIGALKRIAGKGKLKAATAWVNDFLDSGEKLLLFATHKAILDELKKRYPQALSITSDMSGKERSDTVAKFQDNGCQLLIGAFGTSAGSSPAGTGLTLTSASNVSYLELGWTSSHHDQSTARVWRMGQNKPVTEYWIIAKDTVETRILSILDSKRDVCDKITNGDTAETVPPLVDLLCDELARL